jgi:hypothetical protein
MISDTHFFARASICDDVTWSDQAAWAAALKQEKPNQPQTIEASESWMQFSDRLLTRFSRRRRPANVGVSYVVVRRQVVQ